MRWKLDAGRQSESATAELWCFALCDPAAARIAFGLLRASFRGGLEDGFCARLAVEFGMPGGRPRSIAEDAGTQQRRTC